MSDEKPWLDTWDTLRIQRDSPGDVEWIVLYGPDTVLPRDDSNFIESEAVARLIAAAPQLARALALVEWNVDDGFCNTCNYYRHKHAAECIIDAALTAAGLDTQEKREEARRWGT